MIKILIVEDEFVCRRFLKELLSPYGDCDTVVDGEEGFQAFRLAWDEDDPYALILLDVMMPNINGLIMLNQVRALEKKRGVKSTDEVKVVMVTALDDPKTVINAFYKGGASSYIIKPIDKTALIDEIKSLGLIA